MGNLMNRVYETCLCVVSVYSAVVYLSPRVHSHRSKRTLDAEHLGSTWSSAPHDS